MVLFRSAYVFRSKNGISAALLSLAFGGFNMWGSYRCFQAGKDELAKVVGIGFAIGSVLLIGASIYLLISILTGRRTEVVISMDGITNGSLFVPWRDIAEFYGTVYGNGVCIAYSPISQQLYRDKQLMTTPLLTESEFQELAETIQDKISRQQAHVRIDTMPRQPLGD